MEAKTAQLRVKVGPRGAMIITAYGTTGTIFYETPQRARFLIDTGGFELVNMQPVGPAQTKPIGPKETKPTAPAQASSVADLVGQSTDSAKSPPSGEIASSSVSQPDPVSQPSNVDSSVKRGPGRPRKSES